MSSMTLKMTSAWFRAMFTRTGPSRRTAKNETPPPPFPSTLEALFRCMICSLETLTLDIWDAVDLVLYAAEKYDMPSPASIVWALLCTPTLDAPLRH